jgi:hypothetical protein
MMMQYEWRRQSLYQGVSMNWAQGFARWLRDRGWTVGTITRHGADVHIPAIRESKVTHGS